MRPFADAEERNEVTMAEHTNCTAGSNVRTYTLKNLVETEKVKTYGRGIFLENEALTCDFTACGIEFTAVCTGDVTMEVASFAPTYGKGEETPAVCYYTVWVDGVRRDFRRTETDPRENGICVQGETTLVLAENLPEGRHTFRVLKQSSVLRCITELRTLSLCGEIDGRPADKQVLVEFIGDSLVSGTGNLGSPDVGGYNAFFEDGTQAFAYLSADALGVDWSIVSRPGIGAAFCAGGKDPNTMSKVYHLQCFWRSNTVEYEVGRIPDLVVLYLGNNDNLLLEENPEQAPLLDQAYRVLMDTVRKNYGEKIPILLLESTTVADVVKSTIRGVAADYKDVELMPFERHINGYGKHPTTDEHRIETKDFVAMLRRLYPALFPAE